MPTDREMPEAWSRNAGRSAEITAAIERARKVRAAATTVAPTVPDELAQRRLARRAAEDARRRLRPTDPPGPRTA
jgi:hypothetical protein